jgi:S-formylglutathione hydrolase FrmB
VEGQVGWLVALPHGHRPGARLPVVYCLPGRGTPAAGVLDLHLDGFTAALARHGNPPMALVGVDSGDTYWHRRASGEDRMSMLVDELMPMVERRFGLGRAGRGLFGWSMGGYGAILAAELHPGMFGSVAALSPAMWQTAAQQRSAVPDAFDSTADYRRHDPYTLAPRLAGTPVFVACGSSDPFHAADVAFAQRLRPAPQTLFAAGCHVGRERVRAAVEERRHEPDPYDGRWRQVDVCPPLAGLEAVSGTGARCLTQEVGPCLVLRSDERLVLDAVRLVGLRPQALAAVPLVLLVRTLEPHHLGVALEGQHVGGDAVEEPAVV